MKPTPKKMLDGLIALAEKADGDLLESVFDNVPSFRRHVAKRIRDGEIQSALDYAEKTFAVLASATRMTVAESSCSKFLPAAKMQLDNGEWVVLLGDRGNVVTSYPFKPDKVTFEQRHMEIGDQIYEQRIPHSYRQALAGVFGPR